MTYASPGDLIEKVDYFLDHPSEAAEIAAEGHRTFRASHLPETKTSALIDWVFEDRIDGRYDPASDLRFQRAPESPDRVLKRISVYEMIQERHRRAVSTRVLMVGPRALRYADDLSDLPRLRLYWTSEDLEQRLLETEILCRDRVDPISFQESRHQSWDFILWPRTRWDRFTKMRWRGRTILV